MNASGRPSGAARRRARGKGAPSKAARQYAGLTGQTASVKCSECESRLARVQLTAPTDYPTAFGTSLLRVPFRTAIDGLWATGERLEERPWSNDLATRNRKGIAGELWLEDHWHVKCHRCNTTRGGTTTQLVALILEAREQRSTTIRLSSVALQNADTDPERVGARWFATRTR